MSCIVVRSTQYALNVYSLYCEVKQKIWYLNILSEFWLLPSTVSPRQIQATTNIGSQIA